MIRPQTSTGNRERTLDARVHVTDPGQRAQPWFMYAHVTTWRCGCFEWLLRCSLLEPGAPTKEQYLPDIGGNEAGYF